MFPVFIEGTTAALKYGLEILALTLSGLGLGAIAALLLYKKRGAEPQAVVVLLLGFLFIGPLAALLALVRFLNIFTAGFFLLTGLAALILLWRRGIFSKWNRDDRRRYIWIPAVIFFAGLFLRMGFLQGLVLPPFSDSAVHYEDVLQFTSPPAAGGLNLGVFVPYYHHSFHGTAAWTAVLTGKSSPMTMAVLGHFFAALLPVSVYFMLLILLDGNPGASLFGAALAGLGWVMPAHALNFGKYPSIMAMSLAPLAIGLFYQTARPQPSAKTKPKEISWWICIGLTFLLLAWTHSRVAILLAVYGLAWAACQWLARKVPEQALQVGTIVLWVLLFGWMMVTSYRESSLTYFRYYFTTYPAATFLLAGFLLFAFRRQSQASLVWLITLAALVLGTGISLPAAFYQYQLTLFDQAFFELALFLPLTVLAGLGLDSLQKLLPPKETYVRDLSAFLILIVLVNGALIPQPWKPMNNSNYVSKDDLAALNWIAGNIPQDAAIFISGLQQSERYLRATDAGIWIKALTGRQSIKLPAEMNWYDTASLENVCWLYGSKSQFYIYVGQKVNSFQVKSCEPPPGIDTAFCQPQAKVFLLDCGTLP